MGCGSSSSAGTTPAPVHPVSSAISSSSSSSLSTETTLEGKLGDEGKEVIDLAEEDRPPTPFSRPLTSHVSQRPRTTTIFEKADSDQGSGFGSDNNLLAAPAAEAKRNVESHSALVRKLSRQLTTENTEEIEKFKEYMSKKGL